MESDQEWHELCATFSVRDHMHAGAFIAEALLYDRLIIPVIATEADGLSKSEARQEWERWIENKWDPARQTQLVGILRDKLADRIVQVPWTPRLQHEWAARMAERPGTPEALDAKVADAMAQARRDGYFMSGEILQQFAPAMALTTVAVSSCRSLEELEKRAGVRQLRPAEKLPASSLMAVLGHELFVPEDPDRDDFQLLSEAAEVASDTSYRSKRTALFLWQQRFVKRGFTDAASIRTALEEMQQLVEDLKKATRWRWLKRIFSFFKIGSSAAKLASPIAGEIGGCVAEFGSFAAEWALDGRPDGAAGVPGASLVLDAQKRLGER